MRKERLEAFTDAVLAIICTLLVLDIHGPDLSGVTSVHNFITIMNQLTPKLLGFSLSFLTIIVFWIKHSLFFDQIKIVSWSTLIRNSIFLLTISVLPLSTSILGKAIDSKYAVIVYTVNLLIATLAFNLLTRTASEKKESAKTEEQHWVLDVEDRIDVMTLGLVIVLIMAMLNLTELSLIILFAMQGSFLLSPRTIKRVVNRSQNQ